MQRVCRSAVPGRAALAAVLLVITALTGCAFGGHPEQRALIVVASTDVWGSVARAVIGPGDRVPVHAILSGADADPHSYTASPADAAAIVDAALVVYNGGGYDPWVDQVLARHPAVRSVGRSVEAYSFVGGADVAKPGADPPNEHVFYDLSVAKSVASAIADRLSVIDPGHAADYHANAAEFRRSADAIVASERAIARAYPSAGVIETEPVGYYLLSASGLADRTPAAFSAASENETDPSPADMASVLELITERRVSALLVNPQTVTAAVNGLQNAARRAGIPVTEVTETMPAGTDYLAWQRNTVSRLAAALQSGR